MAESLLPLEQFQPFLQEGLDLSQFLLENPQSIFTGPDVAPFSADQIGAFDTLRGQAGEQGLLGTAGLNAVNQAFNLDVAGDPVFQALGSSITADVNQNLGVNLSGIGDQAAGLGAFGGSDQQILQGTAIGETNRGLASALSSLGGSFFQTKSAGRNAALASIPGVSGSLVAGGATELGIGDRIQGQGQDELTGRIDTFNRVQDAPGNELDDFIRRTTGIASGFFEQKDLDANNNDSAFQDALVGGLGGFLAGQGIGGSTFGIPNSVIGGLLGAGSTFF